jgi:peptidyl-dipeptidase Dcp
VSPRFPHIFAGDGHSAGDRRDPAAAYRAFRGRNSEPGALLRKRGLA